MWLLSCLKRAGLVSMLVDTDSGICICLKEHDAGISRIVLVPAADMAVPPEQSTLFRIIGEYADQKVAAGVFARMASELKARDASDPSLPRTNF